VLPPFGPFSRRGAPAQEPASVIEEAGVLPWETPAEAPEPVESAPEPATPETTEALPDWLTWVEPAGEAPSAPEMGAAPREETPGTEEYLAAEEESAAEEALSTPEVVEAAEAASEPWAEEPAVGAEVGPGSGRQLDGALVETLSGVADRLEEIARALRERPTEVLGGASAGADPLELLVTGFALGYAQGRGRAG
jgi:hypothetical protein